MYSKLYKRRQGTVRAFQYTEDIDPVELSKYYSGLYYDGVDLYMLSNYVAELISPSDWLIIEKGTVVRIVADGDFYEDFCV